MAAQSRTRLASGIELSCATVGRSLGSTVVLVPGPTDSWRSHARTLDVLARSNHAVAMSCRGHGDSDKPTTGYAIDDFARDVVQLLDALGVERAVLAGHSGSCMTVRHVAIQHPSRVAGLVLEASPTTLRGNADVESIVASIIDGLDDPIDADFARSWTADTSTTALSASDIDELATEALKVPAHVWHEMFHELVMWDDTADLSRIHCPALLIWGDADRLVTQDAQEELLAALPSASLITYEGVGHTPRWEQPERFARDVTSFARACFAPT